MSNFKQPKLLTGKPSASRSQTVFSCLGVIVLCLLIFSLFGSLRSGLSGYSFTLEGFLSYLKNAPSIFPNFSVTSLDITTSWGIFNGLRDFLNYFTRSFSVMLWLSALILKAVYYIVYFASFIFAIG